VATLLSIGLKFLPLRDLVVPLKTINDVKNYFHNVSGTIRLGEITMLEWRNGNRRTVGVFTGILHRRATTLDKLRLMCARNFFYPATCVADLLPNGSTIGSNRLRAQGFADKVRRRRKFVLEKRVLFLSFLLFFFSLPFFLSFGEIVHAFNSLAHWISGQKRQNSRRIFVFSKWLAEFPWS